MYGGVTGKAGDRLPMSIGSNTLPFGFPAMLVEFGGCATRYAQTVLAELPNSPALLGSV